MFGEADFFQHSAAELMSMHWEPRYVAFIWVYTLVITTLCWWLYVYSERRAAALTTRDALADHVCAAVWGSLATSLVYVTIWAWICALLSALPTGTPLLAFLCGVLITLVAAAAVVAGQRGFGPFMLLHGSNPDRLKTVVFFTTIMTAMMWVGAIDVIVIDYTGWPNWASSWAIAGVLLVARWTVLLNSGRSANPVAQAAESYPATPELSYLSVGLLAQSNQAPSAWRKGPLSALPSVTELHEASLGLGALVAAWSGAVSLQAASTATWATWWWSDADSVDKVVPNTCYALGMSLSCVVVVATARTNADVDGVAIIRAPALAAETAALAVASGWTWYNALSVIVPALVTESTPARAIAATCMTAFGVMVMLALKPPAGTVYGSSRHGSNGNGGSIGKGGDKGSSGGQVSRDSSVHSGYSSTSPIGVFGSPVPPRFEHDPPQAFDAAPSAGPLRNWDAAVGGGLIQLGAGLQSLGARVSSSGNLALSRSSSCARMQRVEEGEDAAEGGSSSSGHPSPSSSPGSHDSSPTSTHYRAFADSQRRHAADWATSASLSVLVRTEPQPVGPVWQPPVLPTAASPPHSSDDGQADAKGTT